MTAVNIVGTFLKDERPFNGLESLAQELLKMDGRSFLVLATVTAEDVNIKAADHKATPRAKFVQIEPVDADSEAELRAKLDQLYQARRGREKAAQATDPMDEGPTLLDELNGQGDGEPVSERKPDEWLEDKAKA